MFSQISQNSLENTCARDFFLIKLQAVGLGISATGFLVNFAKFVRTSILTEHLRTTAFVTNMAKFNISVQSFRPNSKNVFRHPSTPSLPFRDFMKNLLYRQICPNSCPFLLKTLYCSKASGCCCYISPHGMNVETTCLSLIVVAGCSKKIQHTFICNNMH